MVMSPPMTRTVPQILFRTAGPILASRTSTLMLCHLRMWPNGSVFQASRIFLALFWRLLKVSTATGSHFIPKLQLPKDVAQGDPSTTGMSNDVVGVADCDGTRGLSGLGADTLRVVEQFGRRRFSTSPRTRRRRGAAVR